MSNTLHLTATVLPGNRIEVPTPDFQVGDTLDVVLTARQTSANGVEKPSWSLSRFLQSLPPGPRSAATWEEVQQRLAEDRQSWDR